MCTRPGLDARVKGLASETAINYALSMHIQSSGTATVDVRRAGGDSAGPVRRRVVLKFGSRLLTGGSTTLDPERLASVARAIAAAPGQEVVIVSSGAVAAGWPR